MTAERQIPMVLVAVSLAVVLLVPAVSVAAQAGPAVLSDVTVTSQPDAINIFVWTSRETKYRAELIEAPGRLGRGSSRRLVAHPARAWLRQPYTRQEAGSDRHVRQRDGRTRAHRPPRRHGAPARLGGQRTA